MGPRLVPIMYPELWSGSIMLVAAKALRARSLWLLFLESVDALSIVGATDEDRGALTVEA